MYYKNFFVTFVAFSLYISLTYAKKPRRTKTKTEEAETFQPDVVSYSTFGFNDVGTYDGFVPSSPGYSSFLTGVDQESTTRLYGPAFPTALDTIGYSGNFASNFFSDETQEPDGNVGHNPGMSHYLQNSANVFSGSNSNMNNEHNANTGNIEYSSNSDEISKPIYGTKLNLKIKNKQHLKRLNNTNFNSSPYSNPPDNDFFNLSGISSSYDTKPIDSKTNISYPNLDIYSQDDGIYFSKNPKPSNVYGSLSFPRVVDFTKINQFETTGVGIASPGENKPLDTRFNTMYHNPNIHSYDNNKDNIKIQDFKNNKDDEKATKPTTYTVDAHTHDQSTIPSKNYTTVNKFSDNKKKYKKPWSAANFTNYYKNWKDLSLKGYQYSTNNSHMTFKYNNDGYLKQPDINEDEIKPASSNLIDFTSFQSPETDYSTFKRKPEPDFTKVKPVVEDTDTDYQTFNENTHENEYNKPFQSFFTTPPTTTSSYWGNAVESPEYFTIKNQQNKPQFVDDTGDDLIKIPRAPPHSIYSKLTDSKFTGWSQAPQKPLRQSMPTNEMFTRFQSEEDLLGLRNHDTSHPSYLPKFYSNLHHDTSDDNSSYKKLVDRWKDSYLKAKYRDSALRDYESYAPETKAVHVPIPRPYPIEIPHPVIVPVPQPFPVHVPVSKPVAVPVLQEITLPIEKPVPYPVVKQVPYPVEKLVPVRVEKEVKVPVPKHYPVQVPHIRPVFHHTKPHDDIETEIEENDYYSQSSKHNYRKRPYSSRNRPRRPSRTIYERNRRRWPEHRKPVSYNSNEPRRRPISAEIKSKYHEYQPELEDERDYYWHCKRTRSC